MATQNGSRPARRSPRLTLHCDPCRASRIVVDVMRASRLQLPTRPRSLLQPLLARHARLDLGQCPEPGRRNPTAAFPADPVLPVVQAAQGRPDPVDALQEQLSCPELDLPVGAGRLLVDLI